MSINVLLVEETPIRLAFQAYIKTEARRLVSVIFMFELARGAQRGPRELSVMAMMVTI